MLIPLVRKREPTGDWGDKVSQFIVDVEECEKCPAPSNLR